MRDMSGKRAGRNQIKTVQILGEGKRPGGCIRVFGPADEIVARGECRAMATQVQFQIAGQLEVQAATGPGGRKRMFKQG